MIYTDGNKEKAIKKKRITRDIYQGVALVRTEWKRMMSFPMM
jgi:hypothetical protein